MLTIFFSPHLTSVDNETGHASGHADVPLSAAGRTLAEALGQHYAAYALDAIFCSDLQRAATTTRIAFTGRHLPILSDVRLRKYDYGDLTRYPLAQVEGEFLRRITEPFPHGESMLMVVQRVGAFLCEVLHGYDGKTIVVIGHRATRYGLEYWCGDASLEDIVRTPSEWREVPIWRYELHAQRLAQREESLRKETQA